MNCTHKTVNGHHTLPQGNPTYSLISANTVAAPFPNLPFCPACDDLGSQQSLQGRERAGQACEQERQEAFPGLNQGTFWEMQKNGFDTVSWSCQDFNSKEA